MIFDVLTVFIKGFIIGISIAAPVGPIGILCIRKTLSHGKLSGFATGVGAAFADSFYAIIAAFSVAMVMNFLTVHTITIRVVAGILLVFIGVRIIYNSRKFHSSLGAIKGTRKDLLKDFISTFFLTLTNPGTIFSFIAIFAGIGFMEYSGIFLPVIMVLGVFLGSLAWWGFLSYIVSLTKHKITPRTLRNINLSSGALIIAFGIAVFISLIYLI